MKAKPIHPLTKITKLTSIMITDPIYSIRNDLLAHLPVIRNLAEDLPESSMVITRKDPAHLRNAFLNDVNRLEERITSANDDRHALLITRQTINMVIQLDYIHLFPESYKPILNAYRELYSYICSMLEYR